jgi:hypothetical protein
MERVKKSVYVYLRFEKTNDKIFQLLETYVKQAKQYKFDSALKELEIFIDQAKKDNFNEIKAIIEQSFNMRYLERLSGKRAKTKTTKKKI